MKFQNVVISAKGVTLFFFFFFFLGVTVVNWHDLKMDSQRAWGRPIVIKTVNTADDARRAVDVGAKALGRFHRRWSPSRHVAPTLRILPEKAVSRRANYFEAAACMAVFCRGSDIVKSLRAWALKRYLVGRAYAYGSLFFWAVPVLREQLKLFDLILISYSKTSCPLSLSFIAPIWMCPYFGFRNFLNVSKVE